MTIQANQGLGVSVFGATSTGGGGGGGTPGGSSGQVQYNNGGSFGGMSGTTWTNASQSLAIASTGTGTGVTTSSPIFDLSQTWNALATTFTGLKFNVTNTTSAQGSAIIDLQLGTVSQFKIVNETSVDGGTPNTFGLYTPLVRVRNNYGSALIYNGASASNGIKLGISSSSYIDVAGALTLAFPSGSVTLATDAANALALRNSTAAQTFNIYDTYTDASNYRRASLYWSGGDFYVSSDSAAGSGTSSVGNLMLRTYGGKQIRIYNGTTQVWLFDASGNFIAGTDNNYDIGASSGTRPRSIYAATSVSAPYVKTASTTVALLPAAGTAGAGARSFVTDASATTFLSTVAGGGANKVPVVSDGTNWLIG